MPQHPQSPGSSPRPLLVAEDQRDVGRSSVAGGGGKKLLLKKLE